MEKPLVRHAGCGGLLTVVRTDRSSRQIVCDACSRTIVDPTLEGVHEAQPKPSPYPRVPRVYCGSEIQL